ncbi:MAG: hypothetical protein RL207_299 [Bacteroidota bacterium]|jgi:type I restriction-modification system DNA methylase subunit
MGLFQRTVLKKHLLELNNTDIDSAYKRFTDYFHNSTIQKNIREAKEEQFQEGFLRELFGHIMGYTLNPNPNFNLTTELKNTTNSKKADGAILIDGKAIAVIELKGTETTDLNKIEVQAFGYKNNQSECTYVITSNFEKLRFYIDNTIDFEEFNLFSLNREQFNLLYLCLSYNNIKNNIPKRLKAESVSQEDQITKKLYKDYSEFKRALFNNLVELNPHYDKLLLFKKTQKLLDRFLFIFFAEDRLLLPTNLIFRINQEWKNLQAMRIPVSLYERYIVYFNDLNHGAKVTLPAFGKKTGEAITAEFEIYAYNGGLFLPDEVLDNVKIDDTILHTYSEKLSNYDFDSDVDVNILGHIFENSLNEIDEIKSEIEGEVSDKTKTKRKKDGVFYTPKYITKYIVDNTVGKLCEEKKLELKLKDEDYINDKKLQTKTKKALLDKLSEYRSWLLELTICDPACGSGAFLNQALEFLIAEHRYIDELQAKLMGDAMILSDVETSILENNIYGVDLNDESVEIAKLSLWLRTAQKGRKLNSLNNNIKCGNSLIDDPSVAGDKAFSWEKEFPEVFAKGGFDVVIGNPPYVSSKDENFTQIQKDYLTKNYETSVYQIDLYVLFMERLLKINNRFGLMSIIVPNAWLNNLFLKEVRRFLLNNSKLHEIVSMPTNTFADANVDTIILTYSNRSSNVETILKNCQNQEFHIVGSENQTEWLKNDGNTINVNASKVIRTILNKFKQSSFSLSSITEIGRGVGVYHKRVGHTKDFIAADPYQSNEKRDDTFVPYIRGKHVNQWNITWNNNSFISYGKWLAEPREPKFFEGNRIILRQIPSERLVATFINEKFIIDQSVFIARFSNETDFNPLSVLGILNSTAMSFFFRYSYSEFDDLFPKVKLQHFKDFPISKGIKNQRLFVEHCGNMLELSKDLIEKREQLVKYISSQYNLTDISRKLALWDTLSFKDFLKELNHTLKKASGISLTKMEEIEWMTVFETKKTNILLLKDEIDKTDKKIDQMVYELYGLNEEEIKIVEGA